MIYPVKYTAPVKQDDGRVTTPKPRKFPMPELRLTPWGEAELAKVSEGKPQWTTDRLPVQAKEPKMTIRKRNDEFGHKRGTGHYSDNSIKLAKPKMMHPVQSIEGKLSNGPSAALPSGGPSRHIVKTGPQTIGGNKTSA